MKRLDHRSDVAVLENRASALLCSMADTIHHGVTQVVGRNNLVWEKQPKRGVDPSKQPVGKIRLLPGLHGVDVRRPENINTGKARREQCLLSFSLVAGEGHPTSSGRGRATAAQE